MNRYCYCFCILLILILGSRPCDAARIKAFISGFSLCAPESKEELKTALQTLLMSRLNGEDIQTVENQSDADFQITGSYIAFGTVYSLDAVIKTKSGFSVDRIFVQGDTQNELIPSVTEMARLLRRAILKWNLELAANSSGNTLSASTESQLSLLSIKELSSNPDTLSPTKEPEPKTSPNKTWSSQRLSEKLIGIASGRIMGSEGTEIFISGERHISYYLKGEKLKLLSAVVFEPDEKIVGIDVADLDQNGEPEIYVTILKGNLPASQVFIPANNRLVKTGVPLPYILRGLAPEGKTKQIFAQKINADGHLTGDLYELVKKGDSFVVNNPLQLPLFGNLYNFNRFTDSKGMRLFIVSHPDGYLLVYSKEKKQLWKSRDKFGGSEPSVCKKDSSESSSHFNLTCSFSASQRTLVTQANDIVVVRNSGLVDNGIARNYTKNNMVRLSWDGLSLQEKWRSEQSPNYLADFSYDENSKELLLLEVEPRPDKNGERGSRIVVRTLE